MLTNSGRPRVMGILNLHPNSFSAIGRHTSVDAALVHAEQMFREGADIIDVGGEPTNPGVQYPIVSEQEEMDRVLPVVEAISKALPVLISVDTSKPAVMKAAIASGAGFINDVRALQNPGAPQVVAEAGVPVCLMHMLPPDPSDPMPSIKAFLQSRIDTCVAAGISKHKIVIDPGIGQGHFGKTQQQNLLILRHLDQFSDMPFPLLIGVSRKTVVGHSVAGSLSAAVISMMKGANIIRAHDIKDTIEALKVAWDIIGQHHDAT